VAQLTERHVGIRDSKDRSVRATILTFTPTAWHSFVQKVKDGHFDI
jgi:hypothetical protein